MKKLILIITFLNFGCGSTDRPSQSSHNEIAPVKEDITWTSAKLVDLAGEPLISTGQVGDMYVVRIIDTDGVRYFEVNQKGIISTQNHKYANRPKNKNAFDLGDVVSIEAKVDKTQLYLASLNYNMLHRCRYSQYWRELASVNMKELGPLLFFIKAIQWRSIFDMAIAIDQDSKKIIGITTIDSMITAEAAYVSSIEGDKHLSGHSSRSTEVPHSFRGSCQQAYDRVVAGREGLLIPIINVIHPDREEEISKEVDRQAKSMKDDLSIRRDTVIHTNEVDVYYEQLGLWPKTHEIENLIKIARKGEGVGL